LLKANKNIDEPSGKLLLERALFQKADGSFEFSRDVRVKRAVRFRKPIYFFTY